jgi:hypothetical protein
MEAFVYCWTDKKTNMLYVGSHKGSIDDGYICSSKYMLEEYNKRPEDFSRQIIAEGNLSDVRKLEAKILQSVNAATNEEYYNRHNCDEKFYLKEHTEESKRKIGTGNLGKKRPDLAERNKKGMSEESIKKMVNTRRSSGSYDRDSNPMLGKTHSEKSKMKMSLNKKGKNKSPKSEQTKRKMSEARKRYWELKRAN